MNDERKLSEEKLKEKLKEIREGLDAIEALRDRWCEWRDAYEVIGDETSERLLSHCIGALYEASTPFRSLLQPAGEKDGA